MEQSESKLVTEALQAATQTEALRAGGRIEDLQAAIEHTQILTATGVEITSVTETQSSDENYLEIVDDSTYFLEIPHTPDHLSVDCDSPTPWGMYFQDTASSQMEALVELHDNNMFYLIIILFGVAWIISSIIRNYVNNKISNKYLNHSTLIELIWTVSPAVILILIAFPSLYCCI